MNKRLAIIPARGGSKRIPRKNIRLFCDKPIIAYSIEVALKCGLFDEVMVSTDDFEISQIAQKFGAKIPFMRSAETSNDEAGIADVVLEVLRNYESRGAEFKQFCCILPTAPLILESDLKVALELLEKENYDSTFPVVRFSYPIQRALKRENRKTTMIWPENYSARSQDLMPAYHDCGQFYWMTTKSIFEHGHVFTAHSGSIELPEARVQDIDTEADWKIGEMKYRMVQKT